MANVIIPPWHQSAPKVPEKFLQRLQPSTGTVHRGSMDAEMDLPEYSDPAIQQEIREFEKRRMEVSPKQTVEAALQQHEINEARVMKHRWEGQERWQGRDNEAMRMVRIMHPHSFIRRLQQAGVKASLEADQPGALRSARFWLNSFSKAGRVGLNAWVEGGAQTITTLQYPYGPEYSIMRFDEYGVPTNEKFRGWRTALITMIRANLLSEAEADRAFGISIGAAGEFYRKQLYEHRAVHMGMRVA